MNRSAAKTPVHERVGLPDKVTGGLPAVVTVSAPPGWRRLPAG